MSLDKLGLTLYDFLGHLFPGFVVLFTLSGVEATFGSSSILSFAAISENLFLATVLAYFLGHLCNSLGAILKDRFYKIFSDQKNRLDDQIFTRVSEAIKETYGLESLPKKKTKLVIYQLADNWLDSMDQDDKKAIHTAMEGFYRGMMVAVFVLALVALGSLIAGGISFQTETDVISNFSPVGTIILAVIALLGSAIARRRYMFFNRMKINKTLLGFLATAIQYKDAGSK